MGNLQCKCHNSLNVHQVEMKEKDNETYLGNEIHKSLSLDFTIDKRIDKCRGIISEISSFLRDVPFGPSRLKVGLILRESKFLNALLYSSECWHGINKNHIYYNSLKFL